MVKHDESVGYHLRILSSQRIPYNYWQNFQVSRILQAQTSLYQHGDSPTNFQKQSFYR